MLPLPIVLIDLRCLHCRKNRVRLSGGCALRLCASCSRKPDIRARYKLQRRLPDRGEDAGLPDAPTPLPPGPARVPVYAARAEKGLRLKHPQDAPDLEAGFRQLIDRLAEGA